MTTLPPIDMSQARGAVPKQRARQFEVLDAGLTTTGYVHLVEHGIPADLVGELFAVTREFFALSPEQKIAVAQPAPEQVRGWSGVGAEGIAYSLDEESHGDLKEKMDIGPLEGETPGDGPLAFPNLWPGTPERFRPLWEEYYRHMRALGADLLSLAAEGFGLDPGFFAPMFTDELSMLRALYFPPQIEPPMPYQYRAGTHTDYGAFTVVNAESTPGGLQVFDRQGEWIEVSTSPGSLVVMVGDLLAEWTADRWPATVHRTGNPPRSVGFERSRLAFAYYQHPSADTAVRELPPFATGTTDGTADLLAGDHLVEKYVRQTTFGHAGR
ncbi:isopenicillin N synthase family dioxygenase [Gordonia aurantiaca]|uniref:isopenicillin N synthase family dioxygenase n=1 Tax=Gordonia sp. B21 TaxID=3151852 RepID=UPI0032672A8A